MVRYVDPYHGKDVAADSCPIRKTAGRADRRTASAMNEVAPGVPEEEARTLIERRIVCPCSNTTGDNIDVRLQRA